MKNNVLKFYLITVATFIAFIIFTIAVRFYDVAAIGPFDERVGVSSLNKAFYAKTGFNSFLYSATSYAQIICIVAAAGFSAAYIAQLVKRKSVYKVDLNLRALILTYAVTVIFYAAFELLAVNYRPLVIGGVREASYPSSTTLLAVVFGSTAWFQIQRYVQNGSLKRVLLAADILLTCFLAVGRTLCGAHWITDIIGAVLLGIALLFLYVSVYKSMELKSVNG